MDMTRYLLCGMCVQACSIDALAMTWEYEVAVYDKWNLFLNKERLLAAENRMCQAHAVSRVLVPESGVLQPCRIEPPIHSC